MLPIHSILYSREGAWPLCQEWESRGRGSSMCVLPLCPSRLQEQENHQSFVEPGEGGELEAVLYPRGDMRRLEFRHHSAPEFLGGCLSFYPSVVFIHPHPSDWQGNSGLERKARWVPTYNLLKLHWSLMQTWCSNSEALWSLLWKIPVLAHL